MSYRLIDSNALADRYPEVNDMPCIYADLANGLDKSYVSVQQWRPVSEGLPKDGSKTLVTTEWGDDDRTVEYAVYWNDYVQWGPITKHVVAWMLAPEEPYKEQA